MPQKAQGLGLYQPKSSNLIYKRKSGNVFSQEGLLCIRGGSLKSQSENKKNRERKKREKEGDVSESREWVGLAQPTLLTSFGPKAKQTASTSGFILHNHDPVPWGRRDHFHFDPILTSAPELSTSG